MSAAPEMTIPAGIPDACRQCFTLPADQRAELETGCPVYVEIRGDNAGITRELATEIISHDRVSVKQLRAGMEEGISSSVSGQRINAARTILQNTVGEGVVEKVRVEKEAVYVRDDEALTRWCQHAGGYSISGAIEAQSKARASGIKKEKIAAQFDQVPANEKLRDLIFTFITSGKLSAEADTQEEMNHEELIDFMTAAIEDYARRIGLSSTYATISQAQKLVLHSVMERYRHDEAMQSRFEESARIIKSLVRRVNGVTKASS